MKYNLAKNSNFYANTTIGNVDLSIPQLISLVNDDAVITLSGIDGDVLCLDCDLGARVKIDRISYSFDSDVVSGTVASGIKFYFKNEDFENYNLLQTNIGDNYYTTVSGISAPRYIRMLHTVSGTSISGTAQSFSVLNDDNVVDFGENGDVESESFYPFLYTGGDIEEIQVYNDGDIKSTAYALIEPTGTKIDGLISISNTSTGPWIKVRGQDETIADGTSWTSGTFSGTGVVAGSLVTISGIGTYNTKIFEKSAEEKFSYIDINTTPVDNAIVAVNVDDFVETMEIRSSNIEPKEYSLYRVKHHTIDNWLTFKDYWRETNDLKYESETPLSGFVFAPIRDSYAAFNIDNNTESSVIVFRGMQSGLISSVVSLVIVSRDETSVLKLLAHYNTGHGLTAVIYDLFLDRQGGVWVYLYSSKKDNVYWMDDVGYFLGHFDAVLDETFKVSHENPFVFDCDVVYDTGALWYTDISDCNVKKISNTGELLVSIGGAALRGICATPDGGCWFVNDDSLYRLDENGVLISSIEGIGEVKLSRVARDRDERLWIRDGEYVRLISLTGTIIFSIVVQKSAAIYSTYFGVWVEYYDVVDDKWWKFITRDTLVAEQDFKHEDIPGFLDHRFDDVGDVIYPSRFPVPFDFVWQALEWNSVITGFYAMPEERYHQLKLTLRANGLLESPIVNGIYIQKSLEVPGVGSKEYKTIYLKIELDSSDVSLLGDYNTNLRVRWDLPF